MEDIQPQFENTFSYKVIYVFTVGYSTHRGMVKIGETTLSTSLRSDELPPNCEELNQASLQRIREYTNTVGVEPNLLHTELAVRTVEGKDGVCVETAFHDHDVHRVLENSGIKKARVGATTGREWYRTTIQTVIKAIEAVKKGHLNLSNTEIDQFVPIILRPEQKEALDLTLKQFRKSDRMLWNAKMRFGKTITALEVVKRSKFEKTIILTHRPVVNEGWYKDFKKIFHGSDYVYGSKATGWGIENLLERGKSFVYFASIQDLRGSEAIGGRIEKNQAVVDTVWDCVIVDEAHEGTKTALGDQTIRAIVKEELHKTKLLALSGTPFNIIDNYDEQSIFTWDYIMEQECKSQWNIQHFGDSNPYADLPELRIYTYNLGDLLKNLSYITYEDKAFNFHEFFRTWTGDVQQDFEQMPGEAEIGGFVHQNDIWSFLNLMTKKSENSAYPYSKSEYRELFKHSLWMVPGIREARALKKLMLRHPVFGSGQFNIVNVAGSDGEEAADALGSVKTAIAEAERFGHYTITLSCGKLTTGVTIPEWTAVMMLAGSFSTSAASYLQTIFRIQSPCNKNGKIKNKAYVFDFAPDRTLKMVSEAVSVSAKAGKASQNDRVILGKFLNYCPVIAVSGSEMHKYNVDHMLQQLKRAYADRVVRNGFDDSSLYNDELLKMQVVDIENFERLKGIIGTSKAQRGTNIIMVNEQGLTEEEFEEMERIRRKAKKDLSDSERARLEEIKRKRKLRANAISILRSISIRMPLLIYGADVPYDEEITLDRFVNEVDSSSWHEFMPRGVTKQLFAVFKKYYDEDIFIAAGHRIRNTAKEADTLDPTERVKKIASLFSNFKNPDKETVLTPWRVVNMHLSDCLGGYDFFDEDHKETIEKPRIVDKGQVTKDTLANTSAKILEINSKTGLYPLYVAYSIYRARLDAFQPGELSFEAQREIWNRTLLENVFAVCKTPMARHITIRTLAGYSGAEVNAICFDNLVNLLKNNKKTFIEQVLNPGCWKKGGEKMKFNAVVGNPPYQETAEKTSDKPIYNLFMDAAFKISDKVSLITPGRFLFRAGKTPKDWNEKILNDEHFTVVWYKMDSTDIFPNVEIKGGVSVTFRDGGQTFKKIGSYMAYPELNSILTKVKAHEGFESICSSIHLQIKFNLEALYNDHPDFKLIIGSGGREKRLTTPIFEQLPIFTDEKENDSQIRIIGLVRNTRVSKYIEMKYIEPNVSLMKYKVILPKSNGSGAFGEILSTPVVGLPLEGHTQSFISIGAFDTKAEAKALLKYLNGKFSRCLLGTLKVTQHNSKPAWANVPIQDFSGNSDIDWSRSIVEIDRQLYTKYNLSQKEIAFIEDKVRPMEPGRE